VKLKLDENLPEVLIGELVSLGHDVDNVRLENLAGESDPRVWQAAQNAERFLITQDLDFSNLRQFAPGTHHGLLLVRLRTPGRLAIAPRIRQVFASEAVEALLRPPDRHQSARASTGMRGAVHMNKVRDHLSHIHPLKRYAEGTD
jgi:hypothetical protein